MRRVLLTVAATVLGLVLLLGFKSHGANPRGGVSALAIASAPPAAVAGPSGVSGSPPPSAAAPSAAAPSASATPPVTPSVTTPGATPAPSARPRTVAGPAVDTRYGPVQVQITLTGTRISSVGVLQVPLDTSRDQEINSYAVPQLNQETLTAQSAQIDSVSGATYTSDGYLQSLQGALDAAHLR